MSPSNHITRASAERIQFGLEPLPPLEELGATWTRLDAVGSHSFFLSWTWIGTLLRCLPYPTLLVRAKRANETVALALLNLKRIGWLGVPVTQAWLNATGDSAYDCITIEHNGFASSGFPAADLWAEFAEWFAGDETIADEAVLLAAEAEIALCSNPDLEIDRRETGFRTQLANFDTLDGFTSSLSRNSRQKLHRNIRDYEREGAISIQVARDTQTALEFFSQMRALHIRSWSRRGRMHAFRNPFFETFHRTLIRAGLASGTIDLMRVGVGDRAIGYLYNFLRNGIVSSYQSGFDDADKRLRPGYVSHALAIAHYAASGMLCYDFLAGSNPLKESYGVEKYHLYRARIRGRKLPVQIEGIMRKIGVAVRGRPDSV